MYLFKLKRYSKSCTTWVSKLCSCPLKLLYLFGCTVWELKKNLDACVDFQVYHSG